MENRTNDLWNQAEKYRLEARTAFEEKKLSETEQLAQEAVRLFQRCRDDYQYAKALNQEVDAQVIAPLALDESAAGKTATFVGAATASGGKIVITPVELTIE